MTITRHIPNFVSGVDTQTAEVNSIDDLDKIDWISSWKENPEFHRFSQDYNPRNNRHFLMVELKKGTIWWVVAYMPDRLDGLPPWVPIE